MNFLKTFLASFLAMVVFVLFSIIVMLMVVGALASEEEVYVSNKSVVHLKLDAEITEQQFDNPFEELPVFGSDIQNIGLLKLKETIRYAKTDSKIEGIYLNVSYPMTGFAKLEEIRESLADFRESGKWVVAYSDMMSEGAYYLASAADKVYLNPEGEIEFNGLTVEISFYKRLLEKLDIKPEVFRVGDFKSAVEPFILEKMSPENKLQLTELVNSIYDHVMESVSTSRGISKERVREISDKMLARTGPLSVEYGLVDSLLYYDEVMSELRGRLGLEESAKIKFIKFNKYAKSVKEGKSSENEIAVIVADGAILPGSGRQGVVGSETFAEEMRKARKNKKIKAIVVRINSPGGAFQAADIMWREISLASKEKPVIASMSDYAASGGFYLAMACDTIVAQPHTITGSIGVFSVLFDASGFLNNKLGITFDEVNTGEYGEMITISRPLTTAEKNVWQRRTDDVYETFTRKAAEGRNMSVEELKKVASGRVWTGVQAESRGLVDIIGSYNDAISIAASAAGVEEYTVKIYPRQKPFFEQLMGQLSDNAETTRLKSEMGEYYTYYEQWVKIRGYNGPQARMPFEIHVQ